MLLYCVRHGESVYNAEGRIQGQSDVRLSLLGIEQADKVAEALDDVPLDAVYASPLLRARQTAEIVADRLDVPLYFDLRLQEVNAGIFQDRLRRDVQESHPQELIRWMSEDLDYAIPGGETRRELIDRGCHAVEAIVQANHKHVAVVAHGRLLVVTLKSLLDMAPDQPPVALANGSITTIARNGDSHFEIREWNRVDHLDGLGVSGCGDL